ncbi:hypothetical protein NARC_60080 [Candidatus Nitrosocosmicus arcticus]|uniref:Uncharacterized protein n=1 Tax=Candidatus Nitrosocosmicus arcticus TaxID=2035267 RepID=A0A557SVS8_9ARCH|nr:hypothetical protein NARC_60080 [Candidatus Nitrosocosmicus arcticus]
MFKSEGVAVLIAIYALQEDYQTNHNIKQRNMYNTLRRLFN